jgi:hypothetical protein
MELEVFFTIIQQTYSKLVISFMNRKSSCGYATHFSFLFQKKSNKMQPIFSNHHNAFWCFAAFLFFLFFFADQNFLPKLIL